MGQTYCTGRDWTGAALHPRRARSCDRCDKCPRCPPDKGGTSPLRTDRDGMALCVPCRALCRAESRAAFRATLPARLEARAAQGDPGGFWSDMAAEAAHRPVYENDLVTCAKCGDEPAPDCPQAAPQGAP